MFEVMIILMSRVDYKEIGFMLIKSIFIWASLQNISSVSTNKSVTTSISC